MKKLVIYFLLFSLFISCNNHKKRCDLLIKKIEKEGIDNFKYISYGTRGDLELYSYSFNDSTDYWWTFNTKTEEYNLTSDSLYIQFKQTISNPIEYSKKMRTLIASLNIIGIAQSPWRGNLVRFWISNKEILCYVNPEFKFDDNFKENWLNEILRSEKLKDNWYYIKSELNR